jgi:hypothetical protein
MRTLRPTLLLLLLATVAVGQTVREKSFDPFAAFKFAAVAEKRLGGKIIASVDSGDTVHPALSPDGTVLAYSKAVVKAGYEGTEILLLELNRRRTSLLMDANLVDMFATYSTFVTDLDWINSRRLRAIVADGDVDSMLLTFDTRGKKLIGMRSARPVEDATGSFPLPEQFSRSYPKARALFPAFPEPVLKHALYNHAFLVAQRGIVLQKNHAGHDRSILFLDFESRTMKPLLELPERSEFRLSGGLAFGGSILFVVAGNSQAYLLEYREGKLRGLMKTAYRAGAPLSVEVKGRSVKEVVFLLRVVPTYEEGDNPLLIFDGKNLRRATDYAQLHDASINAKARRVAFCYWKGGQRRLSVATLRR